MHRAAGADSPLGRDLAIILDILALLGMDSQSYMGRSGDEHAEDLMPHLLPRLYELVGVTDERLLFIGQKLLNLLIAVIVGAPAERLENEFFQVCTPVREHLVQLVDGEGRLGEAINNLVGAATYIHNMTIQGKTIEQMALFKPGDDGQEPVAMIVLSAVLDLIVPFISDDLRKPLEAVLQLMNDFAQLAVDPSKQTLRNRQESIVKNLAECLSAPQHTVSGVLALARGDWGEATELCRPFCNLDPELLKQLSRYLPSVRDTIFPKAQDAAGAQGASLEEKKNQFIARAKAIGDSALRGGGGAMELFELTDLDGDGRISVEEFRLVIRRLGYRLSDHRIDEILSRCKGNALKKAHVDKKDLEGMTMPEFKSALDYLQQRVTLDSMSLLGNSWGRLVAILVFLMFVLLLTFCFLYAGISAFTTGGVFSSIINSGMAIGSGLALARQKQGASVQDSESKERVKSIVVDVKDTIYGDE
eukprot:TRINITY_DN63525_c0_g1_i1.p1 TRINITY_DN63525_c0_g1~~TRINITY_DN63525_c0_g1_i1.p1  ORF type:complete len:545 (+),score=71.08 TRINITY_DN63525_c0_g1_i1:213-1637(+)